MIELYYCECLRYFILCYRRKVIYFITWYDIRFIFYMTFMHGKGYLVTMLLISHSPFTIPHFGKMLLVGDDCYSYLRRPWEQVQCWWWMYIGIYFIIFFGSIYWKCLNVCCRLNFRWWSTMKQMMVPLKNMFLLTVGMMLIVLYFVWASQGTEVARRYAHQENVFVCHISFEVLL